MIKEFNKIEEIQKYYNKESNTYIFKENSEYIDTVVFNFDLNVEANINAWNIHANNIDANNIDSMNIDANNIYASNIRAYNINSRNIYATEIRANNIEANEISYYAVCVAYGSIKCKSIQGRMKNAKHFVLDGELEVLENG